MSWRKFIASCLLTNVGCFFAITRFNLMSCSQWLSPLVVLSGFRNSSATISDLTKNRALLWRHRYSACRWFGWLAKIITYYFLYLGLFYWISFELPVTNRWKSDFFCNIQAVFLTCKFVFQHLFAYIRVTPNFLACECMRLLLNVSWVNSKYSANSSYVWQQYSLNNAFASNFFGAQDVLSLLQYIFLRIIQN